MFIKEEHFEKAMKYLKDRLDRIDRRLEKLSEPKYYLDGERLYDNQDLCQLLHVSKRTLQRYRSAGELPFYTLYHKTMYKESDVSNFIRLNFEKDIQNKSHKNEL